MIGVVDADAVRRIAMSNWKACGHHDDEGSERWACPLPGSPRGVVEPTDDPGQPESPGTSPC